MIDVFNLLNFTENFNDTKYIIVFSIQLVIAIINFIQEIKQLIILSGLVVILVTLTNSLIYTKLIDFKYRYIISDCATFIFTSGVFILIISDLLEIQLVNFLGIIIFTSTILLYQRASVCINFISFSICNFLQAQKIINLIDFNPPRMFFIYILCTLSSFQLVYQIIQLDEQNQKFKFLNEKVQDQLMKVIHDLKNPILAIQSIANQESSTDLVTVYKEINEEAEQGLEMLETLKLTFKVHNSMKLNEEPQKVKLEEYLLLMLNTHTKMANNCKDKLNSFMQMGTPEYATFPKNIVKRILNNFITNSLKHTGKGLVELSAGLEEVTEGKESIERQGLDWHQVGTLDPKATYLCFQVRDTGRGIPKDKMKKIFQKHESDESGNNWDGTGIGLIICHSLCQQINAQIKQKSIEDRGSLFRLQVSIQDSHNSQNLNSNDKQIKNTCVSDSNQINTQRNQSKDKDNFNNKLNVVDDNINNNEFKSGKGGDNNITLFESNREIQNNYTKNDKCKDNNKLKDHNLNKIIEINNNVNIQKEKNECNESKEFQSSKILKTQSVINFNQRDIQNLNQFNQDETVIKSIEPLKKTDLKDFNSEFQKYDREEIYHILIAEDSPVLLKTYSKYLSKYNMHFKTFTNGQECRDYVVQHQTQVKRFLIFTDNQMPLMTGTQLAVDLRNKNINCIIILISADELIDKANCELFDEMQVKPMKNSKFLDQIIKYSTE